MAGFRVLQRFFQQDLLQIAKLPVRQIGGLTNTCDKSLTQIGKGRFNARDDRPYVSICADTIKDYKGEYTGKAKGDNWRILPRKTPFMDQKDRQ